ncbi:MAG TPA: hypothetical protein VF030_10570, partial [Solirubrobacterales bacterium]
GVDGSGEGLGLLPLVTTFDREKLVRRTRARFALELPGPWKALAGQELEGYEIRHGRTSAAGPAEEALEGGLGWAYGRVLGISVHGLFEQPDLVAALLGTAPPRSLDAALDELADAVVPALDLDLVERLAGVGR